MAHKSAVFSGNIAGNFLSILKAIKRTFHQWTVCSASMIWGPTKWVSKKGRNEVKGATCGNSQMAVSGRLTPKGGGLRFKNPIGVSAGFDKNSEMIDFFLHNPIDIGFAEMGSVSAHSWAGNPKPRVFRLPQDKAIINRMGLNNDGIETILSRLMNSDLVKKCVGCDGTPLGLNITKTPDSAIEGDRAVDDFITSFKTIQNVKNLKWVTLNISCPNTAEGKTFEDPGALRQLLGALVRNGTTESNGRKPKIFLKLAPPPPDANEPSQLAASGPSWESSAKETIEIAKEFGVDALIIANTVPDRQIVLQSRDFEVVKERGGLSGPPIFGRSTNLIKMAADSGIDVIGVGGVSSGKDAFELIQAGAKAIQIYTAMVYDGPGVFKDIRNGLEREIIVRGFRSLRELHANAYRRM
jgi:dihydroorotate dehydrogenase